MTTAPAQNALEELRKYTTIVADSGEFLTFIPYSPTDATTNPTLILQSASAVSEPTYKKIVDAVVAKAKALQGTHAEKVNSALTEVGVAWGIEILNHVPGRVSTEVDARLSFDVEGTIAKAREVIGLYAKAGIGRERVLVKIAATWEGVQACKVLEAEGIHCNMTLIFSLAQAAACAEVGATLISPFAGRISDFFKEKTGKAPASIEEDPGVVSVAKIYDYFKAFGYKTQVMGASFRTKEQVMQLAGCDLLTISPKLLGELQKSPASLVSKKLGLKATKPERIPFQEKVFRYLLNADEMATVKLSDGIRRFCDDIVSLEKTLSAAIQATREQFDSLQQYNIVQEPRK